MPNYHPVERSFFYGGEMNPTDIEIDISVIENQFAYNAEDGILTRKSNGKEAGGPNIYKGKYRYKRVRVGERKVMYHRIAWALYYGEWPDGEVDHISGDTLDNRICNLRSVDKKENKKNKARYSNNRSGHPGVFQKRGRWYAVINHEGECVPLGGYESKDGAIRARLEAEDKYRFHRNHGKRMVDATPSKGAR